MNYFLVITNSKGESRVVPIEDVSDIPVEAGDDIVVMDEKGNPVDVSLRPDGEDLVIDFKDGAKAVLNDFYANEEGEEPITISLNPTMPDGGDYEFNSQSGNLPNSDKFSLMRYSSTGYINFSQQLDELDIGALLGSLGGGSGLSSGGGGGGNEAPLDLAPQAAPDSANAVEDGAAVRIDLLSNDTDPLGRGLEIQSIGGVDVVPGSTVTLPSGSIVTLLRNGEVEFEPGPGFDSLQKGEKGTESFVYSVRDAGGNIATSQVTVTVKGVNDAPVANADEAITGEDTPVTVRVLENDYDPDVNDTLRVTDVSTPSGGSVVINTDNTLTFDPTGDFDYLGVGESESVTVTYEITDSNGATATSTATFLVFGANDVPVAVDDSATTNQDTSLAIDVTANDIELDVGDEIIVEGIDQPVRGSVSVNSDNRIVFDPGSDFDYLGAGESEAVTFDYLISDGNGGTDTATVTVVVQGVNDPTEINPDEATTEEDTAVVIDVLENDSDPDNSDNPLTVASVDDSGLPGDASVTNNGTDVTFNPGTAFNDLGVGETETVTFTYTTNTGATETVTVTVTGTNDGPTAVNDTGAVGEDATTTIDLLDNDSDPDTNDNLSVVSINGIAAGGTITLPSGALLTVNDDGTVVYDTNGQFDSLDETQTATDTFTYTISDGNGGTDTATATVTINGTNDATVTVADEATTDEGNPVTIDVLDNDEDPDDSLTVASVDDSGLPGDASVTNNGTDVTFNPGTAFNDLGVGETETVTFTYTTNTGATETVTVTVTGTNDGPMAVNDTGAVGEDAATTIDLLDNDSDPDTNDNLSVVSINGIAAGGTITLPSGALLTVNDDGTVVYDTNGQFDSLDETQTATDTFTYTISDGNGGTDTATATVTINGTDDATVVTPDEATTDEGNPVTIDVLDNDEDPDDTLTVASVDDSGLPGDASVTNNGTNVTFNPGTAFNDLGVGETETVTFTYTTNTGATETVTITVTGTNDGPTAVDDTASTNEDTAALNIDLLGDDTDPDGDTLSLIEINGIAAGGTITLPSGALLTVNGDGTVVYDTNGQFDSLDETQTATDTFTYTISDGNGGTDTATATVTINGTNDATVTVADEATTDEGNPVTIDVLDNDEDPDDTLTVASVDDSGLPGDASVTNNGTNVTFNPGTAFNDLGVGETETVTFTYTTNTGATETVTVTVTGTNDGPTAVNDTGAVGEDATLATNALTGVISNDTDPDTNDTLSVTSVRTGSEAGTGTIAIIGNNLVGTYGTLTLQADGSYRYVADQAAANALAEGITATDVFTYTISDGKGGTDTAELTITVTGTNDAPVANDDSASLDENDVAITISPLVNDTDLDGDTLSVDSINFTPVNGGTATLVGDDITFDPGTDFDFLAEGETATETITYTITDGNGGTDTATVTVTIAGTNDSPVANNDTGAVDEHATLTANALTGVVANDTDADISDVLTVAAIRTGTEGGAGTSGLLNAPLAGTYGTLTLQADGSYRYVADQPAANALADGITATDVFTYTVSDGNGGTDTAELTITVTGTNDAPVAANDTGAVDEGGSLVVDQANGLVDSNDTDVDGDTLTITSGQGTTVGTYGTLVLNANGSYTYTADQAAANALAAGETGTETFNYTVSDGEGGSDTAALTITVTGTNDGPTAVDDTASTNEDTAALNIDLLGDDTDPDGDTLSLIEINGIAAGGTITLPSGALLTVNGDGTVNYDPNGQFDSLDETQTATDTFTYTISDGNGGTDTATATVTINGTDDATVTVADEATTDEGNPVTIDVLDNDEDPDDTLTVASVDDSGLPGDASVTSNGTDVTFNPGTAFNDLGVGETETVTFTYTTNTGATETVTVTVTGTNDGPTAVDDTASTNEDTAALNIDLLGDDTDPDGDTLSLIEINGIAAGGTITLPSGALLTVNDDGTVVYDTNGQFDSLDETQTATDTFTYTISDGNGGTDTATATVTINGTDDATVTVADEATTDEGNPVTIDVLDNDEDPDDTLTVASVDDSGLPGDASVTNNGTDVTFNPGTAFNDLGVGETETVTFTYTTNTGATETVTVTVTGTNDGPTAVNDTGATDQDTAILINVTGNDSDPDTNDSLLVQSVSQPARGNVSITGGGVRFDPGSDFDYLDAGESTSVTFDYVVTDGNGGSDSATVTVTVTGADDPLVAVADFGSTNESSPVTINVLNNDSDPDTTDNPLVVSAVSNPPLGTVTHNGTSVLFDPGTDFEFLTVGESQDVTFTYTVTNQDGETDVQTVTVTVTGENDAPVTHADTLHTIEGYGQAVDVVANDDDAESSQLTVSHINGSAVMPNAPVALESGVLVSLMEDGRIYLNPNGRYADLDFGETAVETFTYTVTDSEGGTATETVTAVIEGTSKEEVLSGAYQVLSDQLYEIQLDPSDESIVYVPIGDPLPFNFNSIAFNANDNLIYATAQGSDAGLGVSSKDLIQISPLTGQIVGNLGQMLNDQGEVINDFAGVINSDINVYYVNGTADSGGNKTYAIDLDPASPTYLQVTGIGDLPGADYGVDPNTGLLWSVHGTTTYSLDPTSGVLTTFNNNGGLQDDGVSPVSGTFGSVFSDGDGNIQATSNSGYGFYRVDTTNGNLIRISDAPATSSNDATGTLDTALPSAQPFLFLDVDGSTGAPTTNDAVRVYDPQGSPISISDSDVGIADLDGNTISSAEIILTNRFSGDEFVVGALPPGITSSVEVRGGLLVLSLTGDASQDDYETAIAAISFQNVGASTVLSDPREISVTVTDVNDVVSNPSTSLIFIGEGGGVAAPRDTRDEEGSTPDMVVSHEDDNDPATGGVTINVLRNDSDSPTQVIGITQPASGRGMVTNNGDGTLTFNPGSDYQYLDDGETAVTSFTYETNTGEVETVTVIVHGENDAIIATADAAGVMSNQVSTIDVLANDRDPDTFDQPLSIASTTQPARGTVTHDGSVVFFDPGTDFDHLLPGQSEVVNFIYVVNNASGEVENETVTVTVTKPAAVPPVVIDMDGDGAEFDSVENGILADVDGDGQLEQTAWADEDDAVLVYDKNNNNEVDDRSEYAFADYGEEGATDLEGLRHFDSNEDLILDANDAEFDSFKLWQDRDGDGQVGEGEMMTLEEAGIESIELTSDGQSYITADGDVKVHGEATIHYADGTKGIAADAEFSFEELDGENDSLEIIANDGQVVDVNASGESEEPVGADLLAGNAGSESGANGGGESHGEFVEGGAIPATSVEDDIAANDAAMG